MLSTMSVKGYLRTGRAQPTDHREKVPDRRHRLRTREWWTSGRVYARSPSKDRSHEPPVVRLELATRSAATDQGLHPLSSDGTSVWAMGARVRSGEERHQVRRPPKRHENRPGAARRSDPHVSFLFVLWASLGLPNIGGELAFDPCYALGTRWSSTRVRPSWGLLH